MKRLFLFFILISWLFVDFDSFAQAPYRSTIKYEDGSKYVGYVIKRKNSKTKIKHNHGVMFFANGDRLEGIWHDESCDGEYTFTSEGTVALNGMILSYHSNSRFKGTINNKKPYHGKFSCPLTNQNGDSFDGKLYSGKLLDGIAKFANGDKFEGEFAGDSSLIGKYYYKNKTKLAAAGYIWEIPAECEFEGEIRFRKPYTGKFNCSLTNQYGDSFDGKLYNVGILDGIVKFANGDKFEGEFASDNLLNGKYYYKNKTKLAAAGYTWEIPAGCIFEGCVKTFTGTVDKEITNASGDKFIGELCAGYPHRGKMTYNNGRVETGDWVNGMSPNTYKAYLAKQEAERRRKEAEQKQQQKLYDAKCLKMFNDYIKRKFDNYMKSSNTAICYRSHSEFLNFNSGDKDMEMVYHGTRLAVLQASWNDTKVGNIAMEHGKIVVILKDTGQRLEPQSVKIKISMPKIKIPIPEDIPLDCCHSEYTLYEGHSWLDGIIISGGKEKAMAENNKKAENWVRNYWTRKFGQFYGTAVISREVKLGMTIEMIQAIHESEGEICRNISQNGEITTLTYNRGWFSGTVYTFYNGILKEYCSY